MSHEGRKWWVCQPSEEPSEVVQWGQHQGIRLLADIGLLVQHLLPPGHTLPLTTVSVHVVRSLLHMAIFWVHIHDAHAGLATALLVMHY